MNKRFSSALVLSVALLLLLLSVCFAQQQGDLTLGQAKFNDIAQGHPQYFTIPQMASPLADDVRLIISLTSISGDADVYLSVSNTSPGPETGYDFSSSTRGDDLIALNSTMSGAFITGPYYIGVYASRHNAHYSIVAFKTDMHITVNDGLPQTSHVEWRQYTYFKYASSGSAFTITTTSIYGDPDLYVSNVAEFPKIGRASCRERVLYPV